ncbi:MAG: hypothetical protein KAU46_01065 [Candidatus Aminicenantes bacterium]|nr:hypothetical protein [Candidatus Aminicenantes bacterium]
MRTKIIMKELAELLKIKEEPIPQSNNALNWKLSKNGRPSFGGVYVFWWRGTLDQFLSTIQNPEFHFRGPGGVQLTLKIDKGHLNIAPNDRLPLYVGKNASDFAKRIGLNLKLGTARTVDRALVNGIAKRMTTSCQVRDRLDRLFPNYEDTRTIATENLAISYKQIDGKDNFVERFYLEDLAIGILKPIFNVDSER